MFAQTTIAKKIHIVLVVIAVVLLTTSVMFFSYDETELAESLVEKNLESTALSYFDSVNTMMLTGTIAQRKLVQDKILAQKTIIEARILRGPQVVKLFGAGFADEKAQSDFDRQGLAGQKAFNLTNKNGKRIMEFIMPIRASKNYRGTDCLGCHQAQEGDILGAVKMSYDLSIVDSKISSSVFKAGIMQLIITVIGFSLLSLTITKLVLFRLKRLRNTIHEVEKNLDLNKKITVHHQDELGAVSQALNAMMLKFKEGFLTVSNATEQLIESAKDVDQISELTKAAVLSQKSGTESVAAAINQLDASANEVQSNTKNAADKSVSASEKASQGLALVEQAKAGINQLRDEVIENTAMITQLNEKTNEVGTVLEVINSIAEQTNLLALNAAIEAARAGEQGRGFAVVADEVRSLATRTRESIDQIQSTISGLQVDATSAVNSMNSVSQQAEEKATDVENVANLLVDITQEIKELDDLNCQIASAAEQQNLAADEINVNVTNISNVAEKSSEDAIKGKHISEHLLALAYQLKDEMGKFKL
ncbi:MAG: HAMP domain-containing protein [Alteromonadaceae bacterium]|nr:HAMP domain-containing protein [Alteromonadaceae bacterium]